MEFSSQLKNKRAITYAISSGKGGVGKTSIALKIGLELSRLKKKTLLIDCDFNLSNTLIKLNIPINNNFYHYLKKNRTYEESIHCIGDFHLLAGCNGEIQLLNESEEEISNQIGQLIDEYQNCYDYILLDFPGGLQSYSMKLMQKMDERIIVITPDKSSITDSYSLMKLLKIVHNIDQQNIIINRIHGIRQLEKITSTLLSTIKNFLNLDINFLGGIRDFSTKSTSFDQILFKEIDHPIQKDFYHILKKITEKKNSIFPLIEKIKSSANFNLEQNKNF